jgi:hypothetical protein
MVDAHTNAIADMPDATVVAKVYAKVDVRVVEVNVDGTTTTVGHSVVGLIAALGVLAGEGSDLKVSGC